MRDIIIPNKGDVAWVSNLGRNMLHTFEVSSMGFKESFLVGKHPNALRFLDKKEDVLLVSCRKQEIICFFNTEKKEVMGISERIIGSPTVLCVIENGKAFLTTRFDEGVLEYHSITAKSL